MSGEEKSQERGFKVVDRRAGADEETAEEASQERGFTVVDRRTGGDEEAAAGGPSPEPPPQPSVDFSSLCLSLATSALYHLGVVAHPETGEPIPALELPMARQTIDTLEMLERKTRGNLEPDEAKLLESLLYELRMHFVEASKATPGASGG